jgi:hypothetical protein
MSSYIARSYGDWLVQDRDSLHITSRPLQNVLLHRMRLPGMGFPATSARDASKAYSARSSTSLYEQNAIENRCDTRLRGNIEGISPIPTNTDRRKAQIEYHQHSSVPTNLLRVGFRSAERCNRNLLVIVRADVE